MTIADCNNNKLEVSVTSNGLEVSSAVNGPDTDTDQLGSLSYSSSSSSSAAERDINSSPDQVLVEHSNHNPAETKLEAKSKVALHNQIHNASKKTSVKIVPNGLLPKANESEPTNGQLSDQSRAIKADHSVVPRQLVQRHQSCPVGTASVAPSTKVAMAPARQAVGAGAFAATLPPIDNCDIYDNIVITSKKPLPVANVVIPASAVNPIAPPRKEPSPNPKTVPTRTKVSPPVDWKTKLNNELTLYQKLLQNQNRHSPPPRSSLKTTTCSSHVPSSEAQRTSPSKQVHSHITNGTRKDSPEHVILRGTKSASAKTTTTIGSNGSTDYSWATDDCVRLSPSPTATSPCDHKSHYEQAKSSQMRRNQVKVVTPYERIVYAMEHDKTWQKEIAFGRRIGLYRFRGDIGNGNFSQVKIAFHNLTKEKVAVKILDKSRLDPKTQRMLAREIRTMETLHHPNLIRIFEVIETLTKHFIVMELAPGGELFQVISNQGRFGEMEAKFYFSQILSAIDHMHQHNIIHRDIKAENVFFADSYTVKVGDFGFSTRISSQDELLSTFCGSPPYAAPELFRDESYRGPFVDYWALGVLLFFIVTGSMPFRAQTIVALKKLILECRYDIPTFVSVECCQLIAGFLQPDPLKRYSLQQARATRWLRNRTPVRGMPKYDLRTSYAKLLRQRRQTIAERRNTLSEFSTVDIDFTNRPNRFSLIESTTSPDGPAKPIPLKTAHTGAPILSDEERKTFRQLMVLGIDDDVIAEHLDKGSLSPIVGTFRIVLHRFLQDSMKSAAATRTGGTQDDYATPANRIGRSTSIHVTALDKFWSNYARKSIAPSIAPNNANVKQKSAKSSQNAPVVLARAKQMTLPVENHAKQQHHPPPLQNGNAMEGDRKSESGSANSGSTKRSKFMKMIKPTNEKVPAKVQNHAVLAKSNSGGSTKHHSQTNGNNVDQLSSNMKNETKTKSNRELDKAVETEPDKKLHNREGQVQRQRSNRSTGTTTEDKHSVTTSHNTGTLNSGRLSRSWRTIKHMVTENNICGGVDGVVQNHTTNNIDHDKSSRKSLSPSPSSEKNSASKMSSKHHVLHKTATMQIVPNSCAALLWPPSKDSMSARLRRSQTTPNVSTCYRQQLSHNGHHHSSSSTKKSFTNNNSRCIIF